VNVRTTVKSGNGKKTRARRPVKAAKGATDGLKPGAKTGKSEEIVLRAAGLKRLTWLKHGFSTRAGGVTTSYQAHTLNLGFTADDSRECVLENRRRFLVAVGAVTDGRTWPLITARQIHSDVIHIVSRRDPGELIGDGLITDVPEVAIAVQTADCLPVLLVDAKKRVAGVFHAGWRGTVKRIVEKGAGIMRCEFGSRPEDFHAAIGPGIQKCCYEVGEELREKFEAQFTFAADLFHEVRDPDPVREKYPLLFMSSRPPGHGEPGIRLHLDLCEANRRQLLAAGVPAKQISVIAGCTACETVRFFSHRAEKGRTGRMMAAAGVMP
jgi:YfiH family protein